MMSPALHGGCKNATNNGHYSPQILSRDRSSLWIQPVDMLPLSSGQN